MAEEIETIDKSPSGVDENSLNVTLREKISQGKNYFIGIGIDAYQSKNQLFTCVNDCTELSKILSTQYSFEIFDSLLLNEKATKQGIEDLLQKFRKSAPGPADNLILFFSGHGYLFPIQKEVKNGKEEITEGIGCWVSWEAAGTELKNFLKLADVIDEIKQLNMRHILIISDCCHAGSILEQPTFYNFNAQVSATDDLFMAPSRWAICSSRSNQVSAAEKEASLSRFTERLVYELNNNIESELLLNSLVASIQKYFNEKKWQSPFAAPLSIIKNNGGQFIFKLKRDVQIARKSKTYLEQGLMILNFDSQKALFKKFAEKQKKQFAIFTGTPNCALNLLSFRARTYAAFPANFERVLRVSLYSQFSIQDISEVRVLNIFISALGIPFPNLTAVANHLLSILANKTILFEFEFYNGSAEAEPGMRQKDKQELVDQLADFVKTVNDNHPADNRLVIFIIDKESCDYENIYKDSIGGINTIVMPLVEPLKYDKAMDWYDTFRNYYISNKVALTEFDDLLKAGVLLKLESTLEEAKGFPGSIIRRICNQVQCDDLAERVLYPYQ